MYPAAALYLIEQAFFHSQAYCSSIKSVTFPVPFPALTMQASKVPNIVTSAPAQKPLASLLQARSYLFRIGVKGRIRAFPARILPFLLYHLYSNTFSNFHSPYFYWTEFFLS